MRTLIAILVILSFSSHALAALINIPLTGGEIAQIGFEPNRSIYNVNIYDDHRLTTSVQFDGREFLRFLEKDEKLLSHLNNVGIGWAAWSGTIVLALILKYAIPSSWAPKRVKMVTEFIGETNTRVMSYLPKVAQVKKLKQNRCFVKLLKYSGAFYVVYKVTDLTFVSYLLYSSSTELSVTQSIRAAFSPEDHVHSFSKEEFLLKIEEFKNGNDKSFKSWAKFIVDFFE